MLHSFDGNRDVLLGAALAMASSVCYAVYRRGSQVSRVGSMRFSAAAMIAATIACLLQFFVLRPIGALNALVQVLGYGHDGGGKHGGAVFLTAEALRRVGAIPSPS